MSLEILKLNGHEARSYAQDLGELRLKVFWDFPYLYEGTLEYEQKYLETYFKARHSFILLVKDGNQAVGATTGIWAEEEEPSFKQPFMNFGLDPKEVFYFAESVLLNEYRGKGLGKLFFEEREAYARKLGFIKYLSFCSVVRENAPADYRPLDEFWKSQGFEKAAGLTTQYEWPDRGESQSTAKTMQYWIKKI